METINLTSEIISTINCNSLFINNTIPLCSTIIKEKDVKSQLTTEIQKRNNLIRKEIVLNSRIKMD